LNAVRKILALPGVLLFVFAIAAAPVVFQMSRNGPDSGSIEFRWSSMWVQIRNYFHGIGTGDSFAFYTGLSEYAFWTHIGSYFQVSFLYISAGALIGTTIGILFGIGFAASRSEWWKRIVEITGVLPDFIIILLLQFAIVEIAKRTGIVVFKVANVSSGEEPAVVLPLLSMIIIPSLYMIRNVALQMRLSLTEDYIASAKARGLGKAYILFFHALPNVLPFVKADLHKFMGLMIGNLFIVEYFYNMYGITKLLFSDAFGAQGYQYDLVVNGILTLLVLYALLYAIMRLYLYGWKKAVAR